MADADWKTNWGEGTEGELHSQGPAKDPNFRPIPIGKNADPNAVETMAHRIVKTWDATPIEHKMAGAAWYPQDAHTAARYVASGMDPESPSAKMARSGQGPVDRLDSPSTRWMAASSPGNHAVAHERLRRASGAIARTSPSMPAGMDWEHNPAAAHEIGQNPEIAAHAAANDREWLRDNTTFAKHAGSKAITDAHEMLHGQRDPDSLVRETGRVSGKTGKPLKDQDKRVKVGSFYTNIVHKGEGQEVTVDARSHDIAVGQRLGFEDERGLGAHGRYSMFEQAHQRATAIINHRDGTNHTPSAIQAGSWLGDKGAQEYGQGGTSGDYSFSHTKTNRTTHRTPLGQ